MAAPNLALIDEVGTANEQPVIDHRQSGGDGQTSDDGNFADDGRTQGVKCAEDRTGAVPKQETDGTGQQHQSGYTNGPTPSMT